MSRARYYLEAATGNVTRCHKPNTQEGLTELGTVRGVKAYKAQLVQRLRLKVLKDQPLYYRAFRGLGLSHCVTLLIVQEGRIVNLSLQAAALLGMQVSKGGNIVVPASEPGAGLEIAMRLIEALGWPYMSFEYVEL